MICDIFNSNKQHQLKTTKYVCFAKTCFFKDSEEESH